MNIVPQDFVTVASNGVMTDSRTVAKHFKKRHADVLRAVNHVDCTPEFNERNFASVEYLDAKGERRREVRMTKDGFVFLVMGFTGREAARIKEAFIEAFNRMAEFIRSKAAASWEEFNRACMEMLIDERAGSMSGYGLALWKKQKRRHAVRLAQLHPQLALI